MCGLFGAIGKSFDVALLQDIAREASKRGPHAYGFAWYDDKQIHVYKGLGNLGDNLHLLNHVQGKWVIGNARLATSGDWKNLNNNQPLRHEDLCLVHNGNVYNVNQIYAHYDYQPKTENDSEGILAIASGVLPEQRGQQILTEVNPRSPLAMILANTNSLLVVRHYHPLFLYREESAAYLCSRNLSDEWEMLREWESIELK